MNISVNPYFPKTVLKFNPSTEYSRDALINHYLFVSHPFHLNDLMDGRYYTVDMRSMTPGLYNEIKRQIIKQSPLIVNGAQFDQMHPDIDTTCEILQKAICDCYFCFGGIVSLTTTQNRFNELLWSHYTHETGYMIEFDTQRLLESIIQNDRNTPIFKQLFLEPIQYKEHPTNISCVKYPNIRTINLFNATQKSREWSYENEWRLIATSYPFLGLPKDHIIDEIYTDISKRKLYYNFNAIKRIYLGKKFWTIDHIKSEKQLSDNIFVYEIREEITPFIMMLKDFQGELYMSGCCNCAEFQLGTNSHIIEKYILESTRPYLTRSFERMKIVSIDKFLVTVEYEGIGKTRNEYFNTL